MLDDFLKFVSVNDRLDKLAKYRQLFQIPYHNNKPSLYFAGNSLGLQPKSAQKAIQVELDAWAKYGVEGHFKGINPWMHYHHYLTDATANLVGALPSEVVVMNTLTVNLHLMMVSFYRPTKERFKILMEGGAFPSDQYAIESQVKFHGFNPEEAVIELLPRNGEHALRPEDIENTINKHADSIALVLIGGVNYYTGQCYPMAEITKWGHNIGATVGFDLAHAAGNVNLQLHNWNVDFAVWCSYKYLNSGPGGVSGVFIHQKYSNNNDLPRFAGWWGHNESERFQMKKGFIPMEGAAGWQLSNAQILPMAVYKASLEIFSEVGLAALREKSEKLTNFLIQLLDILIDKRPDLDIEIITPRAQEMRGCQISILVKKNGKKLFDYLTNCGVIADWREPNVIRVAPVPLYNSFKDVFYLVQHIAEFKPSS